MELKDVVQTAAVIASGMVPSILEAATIPADRIEHIAALSVQIAIAIERQAKKKITGA